MKKTRALGLSSGGLDSILASLLLKKQGIELVWLAFETPFFDAENARLAALNYNIPLLVRDITESYFHMLKNPEGGYGKGMNPCKDCHALMFNKAGLIMEEEGFDFLFSGEVLGQRPMSQTASGLAYVAKKSGYKDKILRPLSAKRLKVTSMEEEGLVDRELLMNFQGRGRKAQLALAEELEVRDFPSPAGGCLLTDLIFAGRLRDLMEHSPDGRLCEKDSYLLRYGRHFRLKEGVKLIIGRSHQDNLSIEKYFDPETYLSIKTIDLPGPFALLSRGADKETENFAAGLVAAYTKAPADYQLRLELCLADTKRVISVKPFDLSMGRTFML